ncbi:MAG: hypothetical protein NC078_02795 [Ruminococcus sp.]|nr:hypothetical protein [Ruminococcus sp.]
MWYNIYGKAGNVKMRVLYDKKVKVKRDFSFEVPDVIERSAENMVEAINSGKLIADCYMAELYNDINNCLHVDIDDEQAEELRNYYIRGGMYEDD